SLQGREAFADSGMLQAPGSFGNLPAGEAFIAPLEGTAAGTLVVDGSMAGIGLIQSPIVMKVEKGLVVEIEGGQEADRLKELVDRFGPAARNIAELGIGLNDQAVLSGIVLEDEKVLGTVHVALGDNSTIGGTVEVPSHLDGVLLQPSLWLDGRKILEKGNLLA
ncbi:MAG: aminopeptidase, partial [Clostridia bacterium]|nr:aminopeptidase [Clostridia bacterium]